MSIAKCVDFVARIRMRVANLLLVCPSFFRLYCGQFGWRLCPSLSRFTSPYPTWPSVCFINVERGRFCCLDRVSWTVNTLSELQTVVYGQWCTPVSDFIASVSVGVHGLILHLFARTLLAHSSNILYGDLARNVGRFVNDIYGIGKYESCFFEFFCMMRGTQRTLTGVHPLLPRYWSGCQKVT